MPYGDKSAHTHEWGQWELMGDGRTEVRNCTDPKCGYFQTRRASQC